MKSIAITLLICFIGLGFAYAQDEEPSSDSDRHAELEQAKSAFKETWVHPDADFTRFNKLYLWEGQFQFRDVGPARSTRSTMMNTRKREFGISEADRLKFEEAVSEAFVPDLRRRHLADARRHGRGREPRGDHGPLRLPVVCRR